MSRRYASPLGCCAILFAGTASARPSAPAPRHIVSVSLDATGLDLAALTVRPAVDLRLARKWSLSMSVGIGVRDSLFADGSLRGQRLAWDAAIRPRFFFIGHFEQGLHTGFALTLARVTGDGLTRQSLVEPPVGLSIGPTIGFKSTFLPIIDIDIEAGPIFRVFTPSTAYQSSVVAPYGAFMIGHSF